MDPRQFLRILIRRWPVVAVLVIAGATLGWVTTPEAAATTAVPQRELTLWQATNLSFMDSANPGGLTPTQIRFFATFDDVPGRVADRIGGSAAELAAQVNLTFDNEIGIMRVTSTNVDVERAIEVADAFAAEIDIWLGEKAAADQALRRDRILQRVETLEAEIRRLDGVIASSGSTEATLRRAERDSAVNQLRLERERLQSLAAESAPGSGLRPARAANAVPVNGPAYYEQVLSNTGVDPEDPYGRGDTGESDKKTNKDKNESRPDGSKLPADFPVQKIEPVSSTSSSPVARAGAGGFAGLLLGLGVVALLTRVDRRIWTRLDAEGAFGLPVLAEVPPLARAERNDVVSFTRPRSTVAEAHRSLRTALDLPVGESAFERSVAARAGTPRDLHVIMVTSPDPSDGKSTTVANLAAILAETDKRVLVVDCDFRKPRMAAILGAEPGPAFGQVGDQLFRAELDEYWAGTDIPGVHLARTVPDGEQLEQPPSAVIAAQRRLVSYARANFDVVLLDTAPLLSTNDAADLLGVTDAVLFVARTGRTRTPDAELVAERFERLSAPMAGVVLLGAKGGDGRGRYAAYYEPADQARRRRRRSDDGLSSPPTAPPEKVASE